MQLTNIFAAFTSVLAVSAAAIPIEQTMAKRSGLTVLQLYNLLESLNPGQNVVVKTVTGSVVQWDSAFGIALSSPAFHTFSALTL
jgi:hypothetical protein